ncbi:MAG: tetratricopeptide repeat protein [Thermoguttaceae bacterium]
MSETSLSPQQRERLQQLFANGNKQSMIGSFDYATDMFTTCVLEDPANPIYFKSFLANLKKKHGDKKKKGVFSFLGGASKAVSSKKPEHVFKAGIDALKADPWNAKVLVSTGEACENLGFHDVAIEYFRAAVEADPLDVEANKVCAAALRGIAEFDEAMLCVIRVLKAKPDDQEARKMQSDITVEKTIHKGKYAMGDSNMVRDAASQGKLGINEAEDVMGRSLTYVEQVEKRIKKNPNDMANYIELAQYYYQQGDYDNSEKNYLKTVELSKQDPEMIERLLDVQKQNLHTQVLKLKEEFEKTRQEETKNEFYRLKADYDAKNMELAQFRIKRHPNHSGYHYDLGLLLMQKSQFKEAINEFQQAKIDALKKGECLLALGQCFHQIKQYKLAMTHYQEAVEGLKDNGDNKKKALYLATKLAIVLEEYDKAEKYGHQLAAIDFSYKDVGELLDKVAQKREN